MVQLGGHSEKSIEVRREDSPVGLAERFCREFGVDPSRRPELEDKFRSEILRARSVMQGIQAEAAAPLELVAQSSNSDATLEEIERDLKAILNERTNTALPRHKPAENRVPLPKPHARSKSVALARSQPRGMPTSHPQQCVRRVTNSSNCLASRNRTPGLSKANTAASRQAARSFATVPHTSGQCPRTGRTARQGEANVQSTKQKRAETFRQMFDLLAIDGRVSHRTGCLDRIYHARIW